MSASVGVACFEAVCETAEQLLERADTAMYAVKGSGKGRVHLL